MVHSQMYGRGTCPWAKEFKENQGRVDDGSFVCYPHYVGNSILIYGKRTGRSFPFQCFVGPHWGCMLITYLLILLPTIFVVIEIAYIEGIAAAVVCSISGALVMCLFSLAACSDPGIVFDYTGLEDDEENLASFSSNNNNGGADMPAVPPTEKIDCGQCRLRRPRNASHCIDCGVCVEGLDHHCPWTGKCIGKKNIRYFWGFLCALGTHMVCVFVIVIYGLATQKIMNEESVIHR